MTARITAAATRRALDCMETVRNERADSYANAITGMGLPGTSKSAATFFLRDRLLGQTELQNLYTANGYAARIVDKVVDDATRVQFSLTGTDKRFDWTSVKSRLDDLGAMRRIGDAWRWGRLYGGGLLVMAVDDGRHYSEPLDLANAKAITGLSTLDSTNVLVQGWFTGLGSSTWSQPTGYRVIVPTSDIKASIIHPSRCVRFDGMSVPSAVMAWNAGWSPSVLQRSKTQLEAYGTVMESAQTIVAELSVMVLAIKDYNSMCTDDNDVGQLRSILRELRFGIDNFNILAIDKEDATYQEVKRSVDGLEKMINAFERDLVGACGIPRLILVGEQASGLGASSGDEVRSWYDSVEKEQQYTVTPAINRVLEVEFACRSNNGLAVPTEWSVEFESLSTPEPKAAAEIAKIWVDAVAVLIDKKVITEEQGHDLLVRNGVLDAMPTDSNGIGIAPAPDDLETGEAGIGVAAPAPEEQPAEAPAEPSAPPVAEQALNGAQVQAIAAILTQVSSGELAPGGGLWLIKISVPSAVDTPAKLAQAEAAINEAAAKAAKLPAAPVEGQPPSSSSPTVAAEQAPTDEDEPEDEEHPVDVAWSNDPLPADAMTAKEIAVTIGVKTGRVTKLVREGRLRQWNVLGKKLISLRDVRAIILEDNTADSVAKVDGEHSLTVSIRPPRSIAQWVPYNPDRPLPPHVTIIHCSDVRSVPAATFIEALQELARASAPIPLTTGDVGYFDHDDQRVAFSTILGDLAGLHAKVLDLAGASGVECKTHESGYHPHMTLAQLPVGADYTGASPPVGSAWDADAIVVEYAGTTTIFPLTGIDDATVRDAGFNPSK